MQKFNEKLLFNYNPSSQTMTKALLVTEKLGKLNVRLRDVFKDYKKASRIFAFIESKYSSKIEGIYTTLFDVVNTGAETKQQKIIKPIVNELFKSKEALTVERIIELSEIMNSSIDQSKRFDEDFGIYKVVDGKKNKIYQPPMDKNEINKLLKKVITKSNKDQNIIEMLHTHILFEKVHPFVDSNGRLGRLILQRSLARLMNFSNVIPLSWSFFTNLSDYYSSLDIKTEEDLDKGIQTLLDIVLKMYKTTKQFINDLNIWSTKWIPVVLNTSNKVSQEIAEDIVLTLQTQRNYIERTYKLNVRTIDTIFKKINDEGLPFNYKKANRKNLYWNLELEELIDKNFKG